MSADRSLCSICAWRNECKKRFRPGAGINCPDFTRDLTIKTEDEKDLDSKGEGKTSESKTKKKLWPI